MRPLQETRRLRRQQHRDPLPVLRLEDLLQGAPDDGEARTALLASMRGVARVIALVET
jgi:hypothetical protein